MIATTIPSEARNVADNIKDLFPELRQYNTLCSIITLFILGKTSLYQTVREMSFSPSVSTLSRSIKKMRPNRLIRRMRRSIARKLQNIDPEDLVYVLDDTANPKYSKLLHRCGNWGSSSGVYLGQKIMVLAVVHKKTKKIYPVGFRILPKRKSSDSPNAHWHANQLVAEALEAQIRANTLVADSWFDSVKLMSNIQAQGVHMVVEIKKNRKVRANPGPYVKWSDLSTEFAGQGRERARTDWESKKVKEGKKVGMVLAEMVLQVKARSCPLKIVAAYKRRNGVEALLVRV